MRIGAFAALLAAVFGFSGAGAAETYLPSTLSPQQVLAKARAPRGHVQSGSYHATYERTRGASKTPQSTCSRSSNSYDLNSVRRK